jgi:hypothetical protein
MLEKVTLAAAELKVVFANGTYADTPAGMITP